MKENQKNFIFEKFNDCATTYALGLKIWCEENPDLTLDQVLEKAKSVSTDEHFDNFDKAANFLRTNAEFLEVKLA